VGYRPPDPIPGLRPWTPLQLSRPQTLCGFAPIPNLLLPLLLYARAIPPKLISGCKDNQRLRHLLPRTFEKMSLIIWQKEVTLITLYMSLRIKRRATMSDYPRRRGCIAYLSPKSNFHLKKKLFTRYLFSAPISVFLSHFTAWQLNRYNFRFRSWFRKVCQKEELCNIHFMWMN